MTDRDALVAAVRASAEDDLPRLVYADWLEENDRPERAEFIRLQCRTARSTSAEPDWLPSKLREFELLTRNRSEWLSEGGYSEDAASLLGVGWFRGFFRCVPIQRPLDGPNGCYHVGEPAPVSGWLSSAADTAAAPPHRLIFPNFDPSFGPALRLPWYRAVRSVTAWGSGVANFCEFLAGLPPDCWPSLRHVSFWGPPTNLDHLADTPAARQVTEFELYLQPRSYELEGLGHRPPQTLLERAGRLFRAADGVPTGHLRRWAHRVAGRTERLELQYPTAAQVAALFRRTRWPLLRTLVFRYAMPELLPELARADLPALNELRVILPFNIASTYHASDPQLLNWASELVAAPFTPTLERLQLRNWPAEMLARFLTNSRGNSLKWLSVSTNDPPAFRLSDLHQLPVLRQLGSLDIDGVRDRLDTLASPEVLPGLHSIRVMRHEPVSTVAPLLWRGGRRTVIASEPPVGRNAYSWTEH